jgi:hypothetical protein
MSYIEDLKTRRDVVAAELAAMDSTKSGGKPSYSIDGQSVSHTEYKLGLYKELAELNKLISLLPYEVEVRGYSS